MLLALRVHAQSDDRVVLAEADAVNVDDEHR
jgi:hypothetical protein